MKPSEKRIILLVGITSTVSFFLIDFFVPSLPNMAHYFGFNNTVAQTIAGFYLIGLGFSQLFYGRLSDKYGRKPALLFGLALTCIANTSILFASTIPTLLSLRLLSGLGAGATPPICRAILHDHFGGKQLLKANAYLSMFITSSPAIAPFLSGFMQQRFDWQANFIAVSAWIALIFLVLAFIFKDNKKAERARGNQAKIMKHYKILLTNRDFLVSAFISCFAIASGLCYFVMTPFIFQNMLHLDPSHNGALYAFNAIATFFGAYFVRLRSTTSPPENLIKRALIISLTGAVTICIPAAMNWTNLATIVLPMMLVSFSFGMLMPSTGTIAIRNFREFSGTCVSLLGFIRMLGSAIIISIVSFLPQSSQLTLGITLLILALSSLIGSTLWLVEKKA